MLALKPPPPQREQLGIRLGATRTKNRALSKHTRPAAVTADEEDDFVTTCLAETLIMRTSIYRTWSMLVETLQQMEAELDQ